MHNKVHMHTKPSLVPQECAQELGRHGVSSGMDRELLEAEVRRIRTSGVTSASDVLEQLHKSAEWATVTISQVRRINTACKNLEPQLDAADKAAKRKAADQKRDRSGRARPAEEAAKKKRLEESQLAPRHLYTTWNPRSLLAWCSGTLGMSILETVAHIPPVHTFSPDHQHHLDSRSQPSSSLG